MKTPFKYLLFLLLAVISSCGEKDFFDDIADEHRPLITDNDTLVFNDSTNNNTDTFHINFRDYFDITDSYYYSEIILIFYQNLSTKRNSNLFSIYQGSMSVVLSIDSKYDYDRIEYTVNQSNIQKQDLLVRGVMYPSTYVLNQYRFDTDTLPKTVYYSLKHGIIRYDYADGRKYELVSK